MEESLLIQSLDTLWFFSNVLSSSQTKPNFESFHRNTTEEEDPQKSTKPILQTQQNESPNAEPAAETKPTELAKPAKKEKRSKREKRKGKRKILGELYQPGFDCGVNNWGLNYMDTCSCGGYEMFGSQKQLVKMPPLSDGMAMKEHLKSWAYAVACTVR